MGNALLLTSSTVINQVNVFQGLEFRNYFENREQGY